MTILRFTRAEVYAFSQQGIMNIHALEHWDICNALKEGKTKEQVAMDYRKSEDHIKYIKRCKCPQ